MFIGFPNSAGPRGGAVGRQLDSRWLVESNWAGCQWRELRGLNRVRNKRWMHKDRPRGTTRRMHWNRLRRDLPNRWANRDDVPMKAR